MASGRRPVRRRCDRRRLVGSSRHDGTRGATRDAASALGRALAHRDPCAGRANTPGLRCDSRPRADRRGCGARAPAVLGASGLRRPAVLSGASVRARHRPSGPPEGTSRLTARAVAQPANGRGGHEHSRLPGLRSNRALHVARHRQSSLADWCLAATPAWSRTGVPPAPGLPARRLSAPDRLERHGTGQTTHRQGVPGRARPAGRAGARLRTAHARQGRSDVAFRPRPECLAAPGLCGTATGRCGWRRHICARSSEVPSSA